MPSKKLKTQKTTKSVSKFLNEVENEQRRKDAKVILKLMKEITKEKPTMWGPSIIGFGEYKYKRRDGSEHTFLLTGFSPRKTALTIYIMPGYKEYPDLMKKLGTYKKGASCLYIKKLEDVDMKVLKQLITKGYKDMKKMAKTTFTY